MQNLIHNHYESKNVCVPISIAAIPVGAAKRTFGRFGLSPSFRNILSAALEVTSIKNDFPTPPPPMGNC